MTENISYGFNYMWSYWKDKRGILDALECDYPQTLASNPQLQHAVSMVRAGEALIDQIMNEICPDDEIGV